MFNKRLCTPSALILISFLGASASNADNPPCYDLASLQGQYALIETYGANVAKAFGMRYFDGNGNLTGPFVLNEPTAGSTIGARTIVTGSQTGTYTVNCDGSGVITTMLTTSNGITATQMYDFVITGAIVQDGFGGAIIATALVDAQRTPSAIIPGGIFLSRTYKRLPYQPGPRMQ